MSEHTSLNIGYHLSERRKHLNMTQEKFVKGILSISQYSRIESGKQDIKAKDLFEILVLNNININDFILSCYEDSKSSVNLDSSGDRIIELMLESLFNEDLTGARYLKKQLYKINANESMKLEADLIISELEDDQSIMQTQKVKKISDELNKSENWSENIDFLQLFGISMSIFDIERINIYVKKIIFHYKNIISSKSLRIQKIVALISVNYLSICYKKKNYLYIEPTLELLKNLSRYPELLIFKIYQIYFSNIFEKQYNKARKISNLLSECGYKEWYQK